MEDPDEFIDVRLRLKPTKTVGDLKLALTTDIITNLHFGNERLDDNKVLLEDLGIIHGTTISNSPKTSLGAGQIAVTSSGSDTSSSTNSSPMRLFCGPMSVNRFILLTYGILMMIRLPKPVKDVNRSLKMFCNKARPALAQILNQLDPISFITFASTCSIASIIARSRNCGIRVPFDCELWKSPNGLRMKWSKLQEAKRTISNTMLANLKKYPFVFKLNLRLRKYFRDEDLDAIIDFMNKLKSFSISSFHIKEWDGNGHNQSSIGLSSWSLIATFINLKKLECYGSIQFIHFIQVPLKELVIHNSHVTADQIKELVWRVAYESLKHITSWDLFDYADRNFYRSEAWRACFARYTVVDAEMDGPLPEDRPLVCYVHEDYTVVLTIRNSIFGFFLAENCLSIEKPRNVDDVPAVFQAYL